MNPRVPGKQQGFILVATLWVIAFIAVAAAFLAQWADGVRQQITKQHYDMQAELEFQGTLATFLYLSNTLYTNEYGIILTELSSDQRDAGILGEGLGIVISEGNSIKLHDQAYQGMGESIFSVQDEGGLVSTTMTDPAQLKYLLGLFGLSPEERDGAIDKLLDYQDYDQLNRLNGAEAPQYQKQGKPAPPNRPLLTSWELQNILNWGSYPQIWQQGLPRLTSSSWEGWPNFNVAPRQVLQTLMGITREDAEKIMLTRKQTPITGIDQLYQITGKALSLDAFSFTSRPSSFVRVSLWHRQTGRVREIHLELHPLILEKDYALKSTRPWRVDYQLDIAKTAEQQNAQPIPLKTDLFSTQNSESREPERGNALATQSIPSGF